MSALSPEALSAAKEIMAMNYPPGDAVTNVARIIDAHRATPAQDLEHLKQPAQIWLSSYERLAQIVSDCGHPMIAAAILDNTTAMRRLLDVKPIQTT